MNAPENDEVRFTATTERGVVEIALTDATGFRVAVLFTPMHFRSFLPIFARLADQADAQMPVF